MADVAFEGIFNLFASFSWHLDDTPGGNADEINPDVLGYIFEKYINQKAPWVQVLFWWLHSSAW